MNAVLMTIALSLLLSAPVQAANELRSIATRPGVTLDYLLMPAPRQPLRDVLVLFPGGNGAGPFRLIEEGTVFGWSFLVRSADSMVRSGLSVVAVNPPSDHQNGMSSGFRESPEHAEDIARLLAELERDGFERIYLVGNSRGTISVISLAARLNNPRIKGIILTSTLEYENFMRWLPLERISQPVLMIHHRQDSCRVSSFEEAEKTRNKLASGTAVDFVELNGGAYPRSAPCDNLSAHAFFGLEETVVPIITDWVHGRKVPSRILDPLGGTPDQIQPIENIR